MPEPANNYKAQWLINSSLLPQYQMSALDELTLTKESVPRKFQNKHGLKTMRQNFSASCVRLNLEGSEQLRLASGLDSRGICHNRAQTTAICETRSGARSAAG